MDSTCILPAAVPARPRRRWFSAALWLHRWTSLVATPFFLVLCVTGAILIFHDEIDNATGVQAGVVAEDAPDLPFARLAEAAAARAPGRVPLFFSLDPERPDRARFEMVEPGVRNFSGTRTVLLSRATAEPVAFTAPDNTVTGFLFKLHREWFLGTPGELFGGGVALLVLVSLVTGVIVHAPFVRRMGFGAVRRGRGARPLQLDLHNLVGVVVLGWATLVTVSGIILAVSVVLLGVWQNNDLKRLVGKDVTPPAQLVSLDKVVDAARQVMPDREFRFVFYPGSDFSSPRHYSVGMYGRERYNERLFSLVVVDGGTGQVTAAEPLPWYLQALLISGPLHFGDYGGLALKMLWCASTLGALFITGNGAWLWWRRHHRRPSARR